jgi:hypothetical protein
MSIKTHYVIQAIPTNHIISTIKPKRLPRKKCHQHDKPKPLVTTHTTSSRKTKTEIVTIDEYYFKGKRQTTDPSNRISTLLAFHVRHFPIPADARAVRREIVLRALIVCVR